jgi:hypothetical protein
LGNLNPEPVSVAVPVNDGSSIMCLDEITVAQTLCNPEAFPEPAAAPLKRSAGIAPILLRAHAIACVDLT